MSEASEIYVNLQVLLELYEKMRQLKSDFLNEESMRQKSKSSFSAGSPAQEVLCDISTSINGLRDQMILLTENTAMLLKEIVDEMQRKENEISKIISSEG